MPKKAIFKNFYIATLLIVILTTFALPQQVRAASNIFEPTQEMRIDVQLIDKRVKILRDYLGQFDSPLQDNAVDFVEAADQYKLDWKLVAAISGVESTFGKRTPGNEQYPSYNGWGWGVYGTQELHFKSWKHGIYTVSEGLKKNYIDKGLLDPYQMNRVYASSPAWGWKVDFFLRDITKFADAYQMSAEDARGVLISDNNNKEAAKSANIALKI